MLIEPQYLERIQASSEVEAVYRANSLQQGCIVSRTVLRLTGQWTPLTLCRSHGSPECAVRQVELQEAWVSAQRRFSSLHLWF